MVKMLVVGVEYMVVVIESGKLYGWGWGCYGNFGLGDWNDCFVFGEVVVVFVCFLFYILYFEIFVFLKLCIWIYSDCVNLFC